MRKPIRSLGLFCARLLGSRIVDVKTGRPLDRALLIPWRGKIYVIGLQKNLRPIFQPQQRLTYWKQTIGFTLGEKPDFPSEPPTDSNS